MYERAYGKRYKELNGYQPASHIAKLMRHDIKAAIARGELPGKTSNYSVRVDNYAGGRSIDIEARDLPDMWQECDGTIPGTRIDHGDGYSTANPCPYYGHEIEGQEHQVLTVEGQRVQKVLQAIHNAYNYDGSEVMTDYFDVNYYGHAAVEDEWSADFRRREVARKAARRKALKR